MEQLTQVNSPGEGGGARDLGGLVGYTIRQPRGAERVRHRQAVE